MSRTRWIVVAVVLVAVLAFLVPRGHKDAVTSAAPVTAVVTEGPLLVTVRASGEIRARSSNKLIPGIKRAESVSFLIAEGTRVTNGESVAKINSDDMTRRILDAELKLADAESKHLAARTDYEIQILDNAAAMTTAVQAVESANLELKKFLEGDMPMQIKTAELKVATSASEAERSVKRHAEAGQLLKQGFITEDQLEEERIKMETARVDAETAIDELRTLKAYTLPLKEAEARNAKNKADTDLEKTRKKNEVELTTKKQARDQSERGVTKATEDLAQMREDLKAYDVKSPSDGIVTYGDADASWRRGEVQVGMTLQSGEVLMTIPDMSALWAVVDVPEADIHKVKVGQSAALSIEAVAGRSFNGKVERVAEVANPGGWLESAVKEFKVHIALEQVDVMRPGFSCDSEILIETVPKALLLPVQAVFREGDDFAVYLDGATGATRQKVKVGRSSMTHVEIIEGLKKGQKVLLVRPVKSAEDKAP